MISTQKHVSYQEPTALQQVSFGKQKEKTLFTNTRNSYQFDKNLCGMNDITYRVVKYLLGNRCLRNKRSVITPNHDLRICLCLFGSVTKRMNL